MKYNPDLHKRRSIRLRGYNYANSGAYFVTICLNQRISSKTLLYNPNINFDFPIFGIIENNTVVLNDIGKIIQQIWNEMPEHFKDIETGEFIVMPDHIHGIIKIYNCVGCVTNPINNLSQIVRWFKGRTTFECRKMNGNFKWQRNYYEHIIRNEIEYLKIAKYINNNPITTIVSL